MGMKALVILGVSSLNVSDAVTCEDSSLFCLQQARQERMLTPLSTEQAMDARYTTTLDVIVLKFSC